MIKSLVDKWRAKKAVYELEKDTIYKVAIETIRGLKEEENGNVLS